MLTYFLYNSAVSLTWRTVLTFSFLLLLYRAFLAILWSSHISAASNRHVVREVSGLVSDWSCCGLVIVSEIFCFCTSCHLDILPLCLLVRRTLLRFVFSMSPYSINLATTSLHLQGCVETVVRLVLVSSYDQIKFLYCCTAEQKQCCRSATIQK